MTNLLLFDSKGVYTPPSSDVLAKLTPAVRTAVENVGKASRNLQTATLAVEEAQARLAIVRAEIALVEKLLPKITQVDLAKQFIADSNRRRAGLA